MDAALWLLAEATRQRRAAMKAAKREDTEEDGWATKPDGSRVYRVRSMEGLRAAMGLMGR